MKWRGRQLLPIHTIARRLIAFPFIMAARGLLFLVVLAGWGMYYAERVWRETE